MFHLCQASLVLEGAGVVELLCESVLRHPCGLTASTTLVEARTDQQLVGCLLHGTARAGSLEKITRED